ncbi:phosphatidylinositol transfer protein 3 [Coccomyxa sp. Obi]|nr:phosphatidylinositol transfer protein 3 [Coccomyxa sp. Obi]
MGWFTSSHHSDRKPTGELRENVETLLADNPALQMFASEACLTRYLVSRGNNVHNATCALRKTLHWRARFKPESIYWDDVKDCASGGRLELLSQPDKSGRPILLYRLRQPSKKGTTAEEYMRFWVYMLECTSRLADNKGAGKAVVVFDMHGYSDPNTIMPTFLTRVELVRTAQAHYPERLASAVVCNPPFVFWALWRSVAPFLDPITKSKVIFASNIEQIQSALRPTVAPELLYESLGGSKPEKFEFMPLDKLMRAIDSERRAELSAASLLTAKAVHADGGSPLLNAKPLNGRQAIHA